MVVSEKDADKVCNKCFTSHTIPNCLYIFVGGGWYHKANLQFFHILTNLILVVIVLDLSF